MISERKDSSLWSFTLKHYPTLAGLLNLAFSYNGYVAGGYPRILTSPNGLKTPDGSLDEKKELFRFRSSSDVDVWFPDVSSLSSFISVITDNVDIHVTNSVAKYAFNINFTGRNHKKFNICDIDRRYNVQAIKCTLGNPIDVIQSFDLRNSMIGFNKTTVWEDDKRQDVEKSNKLEIVNWSNGNIISRIAKYVAKHGYSGLTETSHKKFVEWLWTEYSKNITTSEMGQTPKRKIKMHTAELIRKGIFTRDELVLFMTMYENCDDEETYNIIVQGTNTKTNPALDALLTKPTERFNFDFDFNV
jgi:hypothetical protein